MEQNRPSLIIVEIATNVIEHHILISMVPRESKINYLGQTIYNNQIN